MWLGACNGMVYVRINFSPKLAENIQLSRLLFSRWASGSANSFKACNCCKIFVSFIIQLLYSNSTLIHLQVNDFAVGMRRRRVIVSWIQELRRDFF